MKRYAWILLLVVFVLVGVAVGADVPDGPKMTIRIEEVRKARPDENTPPPLGIEAMSLEDRLLPPVVPDPWWDLSERPHGPLWVWMCYGGICYCVGLWVGKRTRKNKPKEPNDEESDLDPSGRDFMP